MCSHAVLSLCSFDSVSRSWAHFSAGFCLFLFCYGNHAKTTTYRLGIQHSTDFVSLVLRINIIKSNERYLKVKNVSEIAKTPY